MQTFDYIVIGSGFGGSVSALRLAQKGYRVAVLESGRRFGAADFAKTNWDLRRFLWMPRIFFYGIQRISLLRDVLVLSGAGVGGGSLVYANTHYIPLKEFFQHPAVLAMGGEKALRPFFDLARRMLGVSDTPRVFQADEVLRDTATEMGFGDSFRPAPAAVFFGKSEATVPDPYFGGEGPERAGCTYCGGCMVGCRFNAKNTLDKNYLYLAEKLGVQVIPETQVVDLVPLSADGSAGYEVRTRSTTAVGGSPRKTLHAKGVIVAAGVLGTLKLLMRMKEQNVLPGLSDRLGHLVRTNSESLIGVTSRDPQSNYSRGIAITSSVFPDEHTHIEPVRYPEGSDAMNGLAAPAMVDGGGSIPRQIRFIGAMLRHPLRSLRMIWPAGFAKQSVILLVMQSVDNSIRVMHRRTAYWPFTRILTSRPTEGRRLPSYIPIANEFARVLSRRMNGIARSSINEALFDIPMTAHILGGACVGRTEEEGVADLSHRAFGYGNLFVCDGSAIPANLGVNPSLTITALTERAMSLIPPKRGASTHFAFERSWKVTALLDGNGGATGIAKPATGKKGGGR